MSAAGEFVSTRMSVYSAVVGYLRKSSDLAGSRRVSNEGASINDVNEIFELFDPLPLVHIWN